MKDCHTRARAAAAGRAAAVVERILPGVMTVMITVRFLSYG